MAKWVRPMVGAGTQRTAKQGVAIMWAISQGPGIPFPSHCDSPCAKWGHNPRGEQSPHMRLLSR